MTVWHYDEDGEIVIARLPDGPLAQEYSDGHAYRLVSRGPVVYSTALQPGA